MSAQDTFLALFGLSVVRPLGRVPTRRRILVMMLSRRLPLRSESKALQEQSLRMEERLRELKTMMAKEKAKRE